MCKGVVRTFCFLLALHGGLLQAAPAASITGTVKYEGKVPTMKPLIMNADPVCAAKHDEPARVETLVLGEGQTMANIMVTIKSGLLDKEYPLPEEPALLDQDGCIYKPHVLAVQAGQKIEILNSDGTLHNIHALPKINEEFNQAMPKFRKKMTKTFDQVEEEPFPIKCDVHPWMGAWVAVFAHPYYDVTEKDGVYTLDGLEPGTYEVQAWHERLGPRTQTVTVEEVGETITADFTFSRP